MPLDDDTVTGFLAITEHAKQPLIPEPRTQTLDSFAKAAALSQKPLPHPEPPPIQTLDEIIEAVAQCDKCELHKIRLQTVPGEGRRNQPDILFVGEAPGTEDDASGLPFVGKAGKLLTDMITAMGYNRDEVFITHTVKCRTPENRAPEAAEITACLPWLRNQVRLIKPVCIVALGDAALRGLENNPRLDVNKDHGIWRKFEGIPVMPTFHPNYLLRFPVAKRHAWEDLKTVLKYLGKTPPKPTKKK